MFSSKSKILINELSVYRGSLLNDKFAKMVLVDITTMAKNDQRKTYF
jgi:hypothetical protein